VRELIDRAAIQLARRDDLIAWFHQRVKDNELRGVARRHGQCRRTTFQSRNGRPMRIANRGKVIKELFG
jgi:hypothetical protein